MPLGQAPSNFWQMEETVGNARVDSVGSANFPEQSSVPSTTTSFFGSRAGGENWGVGYLRQASPATLSPSGSFSCSLWLNFAGVGHQQAYLLSKFSSAAKKVFQLDHLDTINAPERFRMILRDSTDTTNTIVESGFVPTIGEWVFVSAFYDASAQEVGISTNGSGFIRAAHTGGLPTGSTIRTTIGKQDGDSVSPISSRLNGRIDDVAYWSGYALTDADASFLWNNGAGVPYSDLFPVAPIAPSNLEVDGISDTQSDLFWVDNSDNEHGFLIERAPASSGTFVQVASGAANLTTYIDSGLSPETTYYYRVRANNAVGPSAYTSIASGTTKATLTGAGLLNGLAAHWSMEDVGALTNRLDDLTGSGQRLVPRLTGTPEDGVTKVVGTYSVNISQAGLETVDGSSFAFGNDSFTLACWVNSVTWSGSSSTQRLIFDKWNGTAQTWMIDWESSADRIRLLLRDRTNISNVILNADNFGPVGASGHINEWLFITAWHDAANDEMGISVNDGTPNTQAIVGGCQTANQTVKTAVGTRDGGGTAAFNSINGYMDNVGIWNRVLTSAEITQLYASGTGFAYPFTTGGGGGEPIASSAEGRSSLFLFF